MTNGGNADVLKAFKSELEKYFKEMRIPIAKYGGANIENTILNNVRLLTEFNNVISTLELTYASPRVARYISSNVLTPNEFNELIHELEETYQSLAGSNEALAHAADSLVKLYGMASDEDRETMLTLFFGYSIDAVIVLFAFIIAALLKTLPRDEAACVRDRLIMVFEAAEKSKEMLPFTEIANPLSRSNYFEKISGVLEQTYTELVSLDNENYRLYNIMTYTLSKMRSLGECRPSSSNWFSVAT